MKLDKEFIYTKLRYVLQYVDSIEKKGYDPADRSGLSVIRYDLEKIREHIKEVI
jgi:hypothetical protein